MFEIIENKEIENYEMEYPFLVWLNGKIIEDIGARETTVVNGLGDEKPDYEIEAFDDKSRFLTDFFVEDFSIASILSLNRWRYFDDFQVNLIIHLNYGCEKYFIDFQIIPNFSFWKKTFSFAEYQELFHQILLEKSSETKFLPSNDKYREFSEILLTTTHKFGNKIIKEELFEYESILSAVHEESVLRLSQRISKDKILAAFDFPEELKTPCEQYLIYFAQFLQDLGINATSNLKEEAGKVLFSVTPTDDIEALDKIREALAVYLNLPSSPIVYDESFAAMRLQAEIERLQSSQRIAEMEFRVAHKALESQDKIILQQSVLLEQQAKAIEKITSKSIMMDSAENKEEFEQIYEGIEVGEITFIKEQLGVSLNPAKAIKTLVKNTLGKGDEIIELGLNKEE